MVRHAAALLTTALMLGCNNATTPTSPAGPSQSAAAIESGTWAGLLQVTSCTSSEYFCKVGDIEPFTLRMGIGGHGVLLLDPNDRWAVDMSGPLASDGSWTADGSVTLGGVKRVSARLALSSIDESSVAGTVTYTLNHGLGAATRKAKIVSARAVDTVRPGLLHGDWSGHIERTSCTGACDDDALAGNLTTFEMAISQSASSLHGTLDRFGTFDAQANGPTFTLTASHGALNDPTCQPAYNGRTCFVEISNFTVTVDKLDRMEGTFSYRMQRYLDEASPLVSVQGTARLVGVVRWR